MLARLVGILHVLWLVYEVYLVRLNLKYNASNIAISTFYLKIYLPSNFTQKSWDLIWDLPITEEGVPPHFRRVRGGSGRKEGGKFRTVVWPGRGGKGSGVCKRAIGSGRVERWCINQATIVRAIQPTDRPPAILSYRQTTPVSRAVRQHRYVQHNTWPIVSCYWGFCARDVELRYVLPVYGRRQSACTWPGIGDAKRAYTEKWPNREQHNMV